MTDKLAAIAETAKALWEAENELRRSAWHALTLDAQTAAEHLALARDHLNRVLNGEVPAETDATRAPSTKER